MTSGPAPRSRGLSTPQSAPLAVVATAVTIALLCASLLAARPMVQAHEALLRRSDVGAIVPMSFRARVSVRDRGAEAPRRLELWRSGPDRTLVRMLDPKERGKFILRLGSDMFLLTPTAKNPVKLSPAQRVYGAFSIDMLLGLRLADSYRIKETMTSPDGTIVTFELVATSDQQSFASVRYRVRAADARPVSALYRLRSGRDATSIDFADWSEDGHYARHVTVHDLLRKDATTSVTVDECEERRVPDALFDVKNADARRALDVGEVSPKAF